LVFLPLASPKQEESGAVLPKLQNRAAPLFHADNCVGLYERHTQDASVPPVRGVPPNMTHACQVSEMVTVVANRLVRFPHLGTPRRVFV